MAAMHRSKPSRVRGTRLASEAWPVALIFFPAGARAPSRPSSAKVGTTSAKSSSCRTRSAAWTAACVSLPGQKSASSTKTWLVRARAHALFLIWFTGSWSRAWMGIMTTALSVVSHAAIASVATASLLASVSAAPTATRRGPRHRSHTLFTFHSRSRVAVVTMVTP